MTKEITSRQAMSHPTVVATINTLAETTQRLQDEIDALKKPWVGLTDEDKAEILHRRWWNFEDEFDLDGFMRLVEAKLKEKNT